MNTAGRARERIESLTSLRFIAACAVYLYHSRIAFRAHLDLSEGSIPRLVADYGFLGVPFFFLLSGFVLTLAYSPAGGIAVMGGQGVRPADYAVARVARVYPMYLASLILTAPFLLFDGKGLSALQWVGSLLLTPLLLQSGWPSIALVWNPPGWSLSVEAFLYMAFPFVLAVLNRVSIRANLLVYLLGLLCGAAFTGGLALLSPELARPGPFQPPAPRLMSLARYHPIMHISTFVCGCAAARWWLTAKQSANVCWFLVGGFALLSAILCVLFEIGGPVAAIHIHNWAMIPVFTLLILACCSMNQRLVWINSGILPFFGEASYAFYLLHLAVMRVYAKAHEFLFDMPLLGFGTLSSAFVGVLGWQRLRMCILKSQHVSRY